MPHKTQSPVSEFSMVLVCVAGGLVLGFIANIAQVIATGFANLSLPGLGVPIASGTIITFALLRYLQKLLQKQQVTLDRGFDERNRALKNADERFRHYIESSSDWFWETDEDDRFVFISSRISELAGIPAEQLIGKKRDEFRRETNDPTELEHWDRYLESIEKRSPTSTSRTPNWVAWLPIRSTNMVSPMD